MSRHSIRRSQAAACPRSFSNADLEALRESQRWVVLIIGLGTAMVLLANLSSALLLSGGEPPIRQATVLKR